MNPISQMRGGVFYSFYKRGEYMNIKKGQILSHYHVCIIYCGIVLSIL